jgi:CRP-like cAMP-binding protein
MANEISAPVLRHWLFRGIDPDDVGWLLRDGHDVCLEPGETIFNEGDEADGLYLITAGTVRLSTRGPNGEMIIAMASADEVLGELGVLDGQTRSARATAVGVCCAYFIPSEPFLDLIERSTPIGMRLMALLTRRLRRANGRLGELMATSIVTSEELVSPA